MSPRKATVMLIVTLIAGTALALPTQVDAQGGLTIMPLYIDDPVPCPGTLAVYTHFGWGVRQDGWRETEIWVREGEYINLAIPVSPETYVRVWFEPTGGPAYLLRSQYYPGQEYGSGAENETGDTYRTSFANSAAIAGLSSPCPNYRPYDDPVPTYTAPYQQYTTVWTTPSYTPATYYNTAYAPSTSGRLYVVQSGDNLFRISLRFGVSLETLAAINGIYDVNRIYAGQVLVIP